MSQKLVYLQLNKYANEFLARRRITRTGNIDILVAAAIQTAHINLEQRYKTYTGESWVSDVLTTFLPENAGKLSAGEFEAMIMREVQIIMEVEAQVDQYLTSAILAGRE